MTTRLWNHLRALVRRLARSHPKATEPAPTTATAPPDAELYEELLLSLEELLDLWGGTGCNLGVAFDLQLFELDRLVMKLRVNPERTAAGIRRRHRR